MVRVQPFAAVRPLPNLAARLASVPYDVVNVAEAQQLAADNPYSFLHVIRSEIDLPAGTDPHGPSVYEKAAETFKRFQDEGTLIRDDAPNGDLGYPASLQMDDSTILTIYYQIDKPGEKTCLMGTFWTLPKAR